MVCYIRFELILLRLSTDCLLPIGLIALNILERPTGIDPVTTRWQRVVFPLAPWTHLIGAGSRQRSGPLLVGSQGRIHLHHTRINYII